MEMGDRRKHGKKALTSAEIEATTSGFDHRLKARRKHVVVNYVVSHTYFITTSPKGIFRGNNMNDMNINQSITLLLCHNWNVAEERSPLY